MPIHGLSPHVAAMSVPAVQDVGPDTVKPWLHVGWHVLPDASDAVHVPAPPLPGAELASHEFGAQADALKVFVARSSTGWPVYPALHWQAPSTGPPVPTLFGGQGTASQVPLTFEYPITHRQAVFTRLGVLSSVALFAGHAVQLVPVFLPSPYVLGPQEHMCVPGPVCVHT